MLNLSFERLLVAALYWKNNSQFKIVLLFLITVVLIQKTYAVREVQVGLVNIRSILCCPLLRIPETAGLALLLNGAFTY
ncbi:hypothetical protein J2X77_001856 [Sphingobacterium sp. 2149]|nr:hypothetical protein [Sphingobacterium sp. 2149]